jgi:hypothetical protein
MNTTTPSAYALRIDVAMGESGETVGYFATAQQAAAHYGQRDDLHGYFWQVAPVYLAVLPKLPWIIWSREKVAAAVAEAAA